LRRIARSTIQELHDRIDAAAVVEDYIRLEKRGGRYWGRCPFHAGGQERTPSFTVDTDQKLYYCFGCSKGGGIVDFVMEMDKISYPDAIKNLARKFGIEIVYEKTGEEEADNEEAERSNREQIFELYRRTAVSFQHFLLKKPEGKPALDYLLSRKISVPMIERFNLGYSPANRDWLYGFLQSKGYSAEFLDGSGLFSTEYRGKAFFSDRLMFPIADRQGRVVAFGGRSLPMKGDAATTIRGREPPKYVNSRENAVYKKSHVLFGLDLALPEIRRSKTVYLAEGYMDVIALHQGGVGNAVASCGTAFTDEQARLLRNWADTAILVFDSDEAGQKAASKGIITCRKNGLGCSLALPGLDGGDQKDPADILQKFGEDHLKRCMNSVIMDLDYLVAKAKALFDVTIPKGKAQALALLYPYLDALESITERNACIETLADEMRADRGAVEKDYDSWRRSGGGASAGRTKDADSKEVSGTDRPIRMNEELFLLIVVSVNMELYPEFRASIEMKEIEDPCAKELFVALEECFINEESGTDAFLARINSGSLRNFIVERGISPEFRANEKRDPKKLMEDGIRRVKEKKLRRRLSEINAELRIMERDTGKAGDDLSGLVAEKMQLDAEIRKLEGN
jgi:DNA primase